MLDAKKVISLPLIVIFMFSIVFLPNDGVSARTEMENGTFTIDYVILRADNDSVSIANDYFEKPATLIAENGEQYIQFWINHAGWVKELQAPLGDGFVDVDVVEEDEAEDKRLIQFKVERDLSEPMEFKMHVYIDSMEPVYDHRYTVRFQFYTDSMQKTDPVEIFRAAHTETENQEVQAVETDENSEQTSVETIGENAEFSDDSSNIALMSYIALFIIIGLVAIFIIGKRKRKKEEQKGV